MTPSSPRPMTAGSTDSRTAAASNELPVPSSRGHRGRPTLGPEAARLGEIRARLKNVSATLWTKHPNVGVVRGGQSADVPATHVQQPTTDGQAATRQSDGPFAVERSTLPDVRSSARSNGGASRARRGAAPIGLRHRGGDGSQRPERHQCPSPRGRPRSRAADRVVRRRELSLHGRCCRNARVALRSVGRRSQWSAHGGRDTECRCGDEAAYSSHLVSPIAVCRDPPARCCVIYDVA